MANITKKCHFGVSLPYCAPKYCATLRSLRTIVKNSEELLAKMSQLNQPEKTKIMVK